MSQIATVITLHFDDIQCPLCGFGLSELSGSETDLSAVGGTL